MIDRKQIIKNFGQNVNRGFDRFLEFVTSIRLLYVLVGVAILYVAFWLGRYSSFEREYDYLVSKCDSLPKISVQKDTLKSHGFYVKTIECINNPQVSN